MVTLHFYWFCVTVLHFFQNKAGQISLISLDFIEILPFLINFKPLRVPLMRFPTVFILLLQLYNVDMTFQNNFDTINFNLQEIFDFFPNNFLIFAPPCAPKMIKIKPPLGPLIICFIDIGRRMVALHFLLFSVTVWQLCELHTS